MAALALLVSVALLAESAPAATTAKFEIRRVAACREVVEGRPVGPTQAFRATDRTVFVWFQGDTARADTDVRTEWYVNGIHEVQASHTIRVTAGHDTGVFSLQLPDGAQLPPGSYRVDLTIGGAVAASHTFEVAPDAPPDAPGAPVPELPRRSSDLGFSVPVPSGFREVAGQNGALALQLGDDRDTGIVIVRQSEPASAPVRQVLERARSTMAGRAMPRLIAQERGSVDGRLALVATIEDQDGSRQKAYLVPREAGETSQHYYVVVGSCPGSRFAVLEAAVDSVAKGFRVEAGPEVRAALTIPVLFTAGVSRREGELAPAASYFPPDERTVHVRFRYEGGLPGGELVGVWHRIEGLTAKEFARSSVRMEKAADLGQLAFTPEGGRWATGPYRVDILHAGRTVRSIEFTISAR